MLSSRHALVGLLCLAFGLAPVPSLAGGTHSEEVVDFDDFDKGETEGAAIESSGKVTVGFLPLRGDIEAATAFSCLATGKSVLVGTADKASIRRVLPGKLPPRKEEKPGKKAKKAPKGKKGGKEEEAKPKGPLTVQTVAELDGVVVTAMQALPGGDIAAATLPGGTIWRVDKKGKVTKFAELKVDQIWGMLVHRGRLLVATGSKGELWSLSLAGKDAKVVLDTDEKDLMSVAAVGDDVVVGSSPHAKLYAVADDLEGTLLHDFTGDEVRAIALTKTGLVVAVNAFEDRKLTSLDALTKTLDRTSLLGQPPTGTLSTERPPDADASVHFVDLGPKRDVDRALEAPWETWLERKKQYFTALLALDDKGTVLVGSSGGGKVYRVRGPRDTATVADLEERQVTGLCQIPKGSVFATTAHGAAAYQLRAAPASRARYRTEVFDAEQPAAYGALVLRGKGPLKVRARVGPSDEVDRRWGDWKAVPLYRHGAEWRGSLAILPTRRYLQVEVALGNPTAELWALDYFYAPENLAPLVTNVELDRPGFAEEDNDEPDSKVTIKWKADARDDDDLVYDVRVRPEGGGEGQWIKLNPEDELVTKKELKWDLTTVPDGVYEIGVTASDEPSNGSARARTDELVSVPFVVDRQRPTIGSAKVKGDRIRAQAADLGSYVHDVGYNIDGGPFRAASPADGLFDGPAEELLIDLPADLPAGKHRVVIRARDAFGNIGTLALVIER